MSSDALESRQRRRQLYEAGLKDGVTRCITSLMLADFDQAAGHIENHVPVEAFENDQVGSAMFGVRPAAPDVPGGDSDG
jgi:hypothetical protein